MAKAKPKSRAPLTRDRALAVAVSLADVAGIEAVTMRRLAQELGVEAMSLYHHVANKEDILDGMVDAVFREIELPPAGTDWQTAMQERAKSARDAMTRHPWALAIMESRTSPGPATLRHHNALIGCLRQSGFSVQLAAHAFSLIDSYVFGFVLQEVNLPFDDTTSVAEMEAMVAAMLASFPADEYPHLLEMTSQHVLKPEYSYSDEFDFGLGVILNGLAEKLKAEGLLANT